jgi:hypothetical protein
MNKLEVTVAPRCSFCDKKAKYDAPTTMASWAYMCQECFRLNGGSEIGTEFVVKKTKKKGDKNPQLGLEKATISKIERNGYREVKCPVCKGTRKLELDADGEFGCEFCGQVVKIPFFYF